MSENCFTFTNSVDTDEMQHHAYFPIHQYNLGAQKINLQVQGHHSHELVPSR